MRPIGSKGDRLDQFSFKIVIGSYGFVYDCSSLFLANIFSLFFYYNNYSMKKRELIMPS